MQVHHLLFDKFHFAPNCHVMTCNTSVGEKACQETDISSKSLSFFKIDHWNTRDCYTSPIYTQETTINMRASGHVNIIEFILFESIALSTIIFFTPGPPVAGLLEQMHRSSPFCVGVPTGACTPTPQSPLFKLDTPPSGTHYHPNIRGNRSSPIPIPRRRVTLLTVPDRSTTSDY